MKLAILVNEFPVFSQKYIINHIEGCLEAGMDVQICALNVNVTDTMYGTVADMGLLDRVVDAHCPSSPLRRLVEFPRILSGNMQDGPGLVLKAFSPEYSIASKHLKTHYFLNALRCRRYDVVHCHFGPNGLIGAFLKDAGIAKRLIVTFHGSDILTYPQRFGAGLYRTLYDRADWVTAGTEFMKVKLVENGCPPGKIRIVPAGLRMAEYPPSADAGTRPKRLLSVGRMQRIKGYEYSLRAFASLRKTHPDSQYFLIGDGPDRPRLEGLAEELGLGGAAVFLGRRTGEEVARYYRDAAVFVQPSVVGENGWVEGQGLVLQEAQANGIPVVATATGGISDGLVDGVTGFLVPPRDPSALAEKIGLLFADPSLRASMGTSALDFVARRYDVGALTERLSALYN